MRKIIFLFLLLSMSLSYSVISEDMTREKASSLMVECRSQRESKIAPLKEQEISDCMLKKRNSADYCKRYNNNFGENRRIGGINRPGLFWDLPVCQEAIDAEKYYKKYPGRK